ncbi:long-chain-fatty-acid--CoA ligase [Corynebacterium propinquum]|uniref:long-chain-fatty-acid--CoA ligase n=1 Tax=Corynebacterium propinquum TaxID=43769 RepID=UPI0025426B4F|nr:long-chain-fatty-acid--CoA ligase [Corynebacterium propinquum]MDK4251537.1 long-chain-fatty-acid--CoA ligase [Corynebacterium propinquum]WKS31468.1 long-chain-fatty-acid--CoA ligase [Corynebacterium propinquum]WKS35909.1 long-chain-fatty-acid--CoA ligase [Corynebacterium propinquum]WKS37894.1 long-chain-fatty-acid--CoA ligase [Corynebacterium propinquum]WKS42231.1 long-chain-fatty-acid--CoA ligase [Corynebacterium propinquum]
MSPSEDSSNAQNSPKHALKDTTESASTAESSATSSDATNAANPTGAATAFESRAWLQHYNEACPPEIELAEITLVDNYIENLKKNPDRNATWFFGQTKTFAQIDKQVRAVAASLKSLGVGKGDRVAVILPNCPQHVVAIHAIHRLGATVVEHNPLYTPYELEGLFKDHEARTAIVWDKIAESLEPLRHSTALQNLIAVNMVEAMPTTKQLALRYLPLPSVREKRDMLTAKADNAIPYGMLLDGAIGGTGEHLEPEPTITPDDIAFILYTSGTTGAPKGAMLSHRNICSNVQMAKYWLPGIGENPETLMGALPMFHVYGLTLIGALSVYIGGEIILLPKPEIPLMLDAIKKRKPTWLPGVPTLYDKIAEEAQNKDLDLQGIRYSFAGAAPLPAATVDEWEKLSGGLLVEGYGLTETSPVIVANPVNENRRPGFIGVPMPNTLIRIANQNNLDETMPNGEEGEVLVKGPQVFQGYLNKPEATEEAFHDGWFRTGDMGVMEEDGFLRLVSRLKEIIITGGFNVHPAEVEETVSSHRDVADVAVVGRPRKDGSEDVVACVILNDGAELDPEGLREFCRQRLTRYKVPRTFYHFEELARDQLGKIRRREVQADLLERLGESDN